MKKSFLVLVVLALLASMVACAPAATPEVKEEATSAEAAPAAAAPAADADNPLAGLAVDKDGKPLLLGYVGNENSSGWMSNANAYLKSLWERAGGEVVEYISDYDLTKEVSMMDDLMEKKPAAILVHPSDSAAIAPSVKKSNGYGYPCFCSGYGRYRYGCRFLRSC